MVLQAATLCPCGNAPTLKRDIWVHSARNAGMLVAQNFTDNSGSGWGNWGKLMQSVAKGKLEDAGSRNAAGISASILAIWNYQ